MNSTFLKAAASYFGINPEQVRESDWHNDGGTMVATFSFAINDGDLIGVMDRMKAMRQEQKPEPAPPVKMTWGDAVAEFGPRFDAMSVHDKSFYGSRGAYIQFKLQNL